MAHLGLGLGGAGLGISAGLGYGSLSPLSPVVRCHGGPPPPKVKNESPAAKMIISAGVAFVFELTIGHYFEVLKIQKQTSELSYAGITRVMIKQKGLAGILDGFFPWGAIQAVCKGGSFGLGHSLSKGAMKATGMDVKYPRGSEVLSGGMGGALQGVVMSPVLLLKTRVITDESYRATGGVWSTAKMSSKIGGQIIKREGPVALMTGAPMFITKRFFDWTTRFLFVELVETAAKGGDVNAKLSPTTQYACSFAGGTLSAIA